MNTTTPAQTALRTIATIPADDPEQCRPTDRGLALAALVLGAAEALSTTPTALSDEHGSITLTGPKHRGASYRTVELSILAGNPESIVDAAPQASDPIFWLSALSVNELRGERCDIRVRSYGCTFDNVPAAVSLAHLMATDTKGLWSTVKQRPAQTATPRIDADELVVPHVAQRLDADALDAHRAQILSETVLNHASDEDAVREALITHWVHAGTSAVTTD